MSDSIFLPDGGRFIPTELASGPWDRKALHGGAPAALIAGVFERTEPGAKLRMARLGFEFLRPIPLAPLTLSTRVVRPGRRVQELAGELRAGEELVCRASALRVQPVPAGLGQLAAQAQDPEPEAGLAPPERGELVRFALNESSRTSFASSAMEMRWLSESGALGRGRVWMRLRHPLLPDQPATPLMRVAASADFGNGVGATLPFDRFLFINADLTIHLHRPALGEWIGLDSRTLLDDGGMGLAESVLHDERGPVGRAFQTLVVQPR
jgi:Thioesterase-like superfamily